MSYYYGLVGLELILFLLIGLRLGWMIVQLIQRRLNKKWWFLVVVIVPFLVVSVREFLYLPIMDLPYALNKETMVVEGTVDRVYFPGGDNAFIIDGKEYRRNPWTFDPEEGAEYRLHYLPNSRYVVDYEKIPGE